jgi:hypothetical protein
MGWSRREDRPQEGGGHREVVRVRSLAYDPRAHWLDLYRNPGSPARRPILIHFHESGFVQGRESREAVTLLNQQAAHPGR